MPALDEWPSRVAIVACGKIVYAGEAVLRAGDFEHPYELLTWASQQSPPKCGVCYDLTTWLKFNKTPAPGWSAVHAHEQFKPLWCNMNFYKCHLVMSEAQLLGEHLDTCERSGQQSGVLGACVVLKVWLRTMCRSGAHRAVSVALTLMGMLQSSGVTVDIFPMSLVKDWRVEARRLEAFFRRQLKLRG